MVIGKFGEEVEFGKVFDKDLRDFSSKASKLWDAFTVDKTDKENQYLNRIINPMVKSRKFHRFKIVDKESFKALFDQNQIDNMGSKVLTLARIIFT